MKKQSFVAAIPILFALTALFVLVGFLNTSVASVSKHTRVNAEVLLSPTLMAVDPPFAPNDLDASIVITGTGFTAELSGTVVLTIPSVYLEDTPLAQVSWVSTQALTATVPWGMDPGIYALTVVNPDGGTATLTNAFTVTQGIGQWNGGEMYGGNGRQILFKPGDSNTLYAVGSGVGVFRSRDGGEHWAFTTANVIGNAVFVLDPHHPTWLYSARGGLYRSQDESDSWALILDAWPDGSLIGESSVFVSPHVSGTLFFASAQRDWDPTPTALGLITSDDNGATWQVVTDLEGVPVTTLDFHPTDPLKMVVGTDDGRVFESTDGGSHWSPVASHPGIDDIWLITYNPFQSNEVWVSGDFLVGATGLLKTSDFLGWQNVAPSSGPCVSAIRFVAANTILVAEYWGNVYKSEDGGLSWEPIVGVGLGTTLCCDLAIHPDNPQILYAGDTTYGLQKSSDGGQTWQVMNQGFTAMHASDLSASRSFPLRIYSVFDAWRGIYRSTDGASSWSFLPISDDVYNVHHVGEDPFASQRIYVATDPAFYVSENGGQDWTSAGWGMDGMPYAMEPDPFQSGRLLAGLRFGEDVYTHQGQLLASTDHGAVWRPITVTQAVTLSWISDIAHHPETPGLVYLATGGSGLYRSLDSGETWERIDDQSDPQMRKIDRIVIATHPQPILIVQAGGALYRSFDGGATWALVETSLGGDTEMLLFLGEDSTLLYAGTWNGLFLSRDGGQSWTQAAGALGSLHITALDGVVSGDQTILYAATTGGDAGLSQGVRRATQSHLVKAGVYRYIQHIWPTFLPLVRK